MNPELLKLINRPEVQEKRGRWQEGDIYYCPRQVEDGVSSGIKRIHHIGYEDFEHSPCCPDVSLWLPPPIDPMDYILDRPQQERRGVWEWIDWKEVYANVLDNGWIAISTYKKHTYYEGDPLTVLLKVYLFQKGVEI